MQILGISFDSVEANAAFANKFRYPFPLLCDTSHEIGFTYGACSSLQDRSAKRITYVIDPQGKISQVYGKVNPSTHPEEVLTSI